MDELIARARALAGVELGLVADALGHRVPPDATRAKGWVGEVVEDALGAGAGSRPVPDFERLGVELKTVPVDARGRPRESTYVTTFALGDVDEPHFSRTHLARKLSHVLFVPVEARPELPIAVRRVGTPLSWRPDPETWAALEQDWRAFQTRAARGEVDRISSDLGEILQIRPKGADARDTTWAPGAAGERVRTMRRGFYLRPGFVLRLFEAAFLLPAP
mgnify:CR=1 FL=1